MFCFFTENYFGLCLRNLLSTASEQEEADGEEKVVSHSIE